MSVKKTKRKTNTQDSFSTKRIKSTRATLVFVNIFILINLSIVPAVLYLNNSNNSTDAALLFDGDFDTGNFSQWPMCQTAYYNSGCSGYNGQHYNLRTVTSPLRQGSHAARLELRDGDTPAWSPGTERTQFKVTGGFEQENSDVWYAISVRFENGFPLSGSSWQLFTQWHDSQNGPPMITMEMGLNSSGQKVMRMKYTPYINGPYTNTRYITETPFNYDQWYDLKFHFKWSKSTNGVIEMWSNGQKQTFTNSPYLSLSSCIGKTTCSTPTMYPTSSYKYWVTGPYRSSSINGTGVVYYDAMYTSSTEASLPSPSSTSSGSGSSTTTPPTGGGTTGGTTGGSTGGSTTPNTGSTPSTNTGGNTNTTTPGSNNQITNIQPIPDNIEKKEDGSIVADFNNDQKPDVAIDKNNDNLIDPSTEIVRNGAEDSSFAEQISDGAETVSTFVTTGKIDKKSGLNLAKVSLIILSILSTIFVISYISFIKLPIFEGLRSNIRYVRGKRG